MGEGARTPMNSILTAAKLRRLLDPEPGCGRHGRSTSMETKSAAPVPTQEVPATNAEKATARLLGV